MSSSTTCADADSKMAAQGGETAPKNVLVPTIVILENDGTDEGVPPFLEGKMNKTPPSLSSSSGPPPVRLSLTRAEVTLMQLLLDTVAALKRSDEITVRIAGGWVRDKILGVETNDLDVALDGIGGVDFAQAIREHWSADSLPPPNLGIIAANPDQSKHLETATMRLSGLDVDFVPLRSDEVYEAHSRIPTASFGTPYEDSMRRDFTMNALYFLPAQASVEDYTGRGLADLLVHKRVVTPLPAAVTFQDDPLRVLRAVRFAVRLQFPMEESLEAAAMSTAVQQALVHKVSRERVGKELEGMLSGKAARPDVALLELIRLQLAPVVFWVWETAVSLEGPVWLQGGTQEAWRSDGGDGGGAHAGWRESTRLLQSVPDSIRSTVDADEARRLFYLALCLWPFSKLEFVDKKRKRQSVVTLLVLKESIKFKGKDEKQMATLLKGAHDFYPLLFVDQTTWNRGTVGRIVRQCQELWKVALALATVVAHGDDDVVAQGQAMTNFVTRQELSFCWTWKPLWDGKYLMKALDLPKGPAIGTYMEEQVEWMLQHYQAPQQAAAALSPQDACLAHLRQVRQAEMETKP